MHPAWSVILFTTASGAGCGLLALLGLVGMAHGPASSFWFGATCMLLALGLIGLGLLASPFHRGRQALAATRRSASWLSREGVAALVVFIPALAFAALWLSPGAGRAAVAVAGLAAFAMCVVAVHCTAMIHASPGTIRRWRQPLVPLVYQAFALATGSALLLFVSGLFGRGQPVQAGITVAALLMAMGLKLVYWRSLASGPGRYTIAEATGSGRVGCEHAASLRRIVMAGLALALLCAVPTLFAPGPLATAAAGLGAIAALTAAMLERRLFFAEAGMWSPLPRRPEEEPQGDVGH